MKKNDLSFLILKFKSCIKHNTQLKLTICIIVKLNL